MPDINLINRKPLFENVSAREGNSIKLGVYEQSYFKRSWHYHPEAELLLITNGFGTRLVGDSSEEFARNDLILIGGNLPHAWISDPAFYKPGAKDFCRSIFLQFDLRMFGDQFILTPEMQPVLELIKKADRGLKILGHPRDKVINMIKAMPGCNGLQRLISLLSLLDMIRECELKPLASENYHHSRFYSRSTRINRVHEFIMENFKHDISLKTAANIACMQESSFARFFKSRTGKTFSEYLNDMRIDFACKLLNGTALPVSQIAYESGYNSMSYFNRKFRDIMGTSPNTYRGSD